MKAMIEIGWDNTEDRVATYVRQANCIVLGNHACHCQHCIDNFENVLLHEYLHMALFKRVGKSACQKFDAFLDWLESQTNIEDFRGFLF